MRAVVQRVKASRVVVDGVTVGAIGPGVLILLGVGLEDEEDDCDYLVNKIIHLRIFADDKGQMNLSLTDVGGAVMVVSQFTLWADCRKGRRPSFTRAAPPLIGDSSLRAFRATGQGKGLHGGNRGIPGHDGGFLDQRRTRDNDPGTAKSTSKGCEKVPICCVGLILRHCDESLSTSHSSGFVRASLGLPTLRAWPQFRPPCIWSFFRTLPRRVAGLSPSAGSFPRS